MRFDSISSATSHESAGNVKWYSVASSRVEALFEPPFICVSLSIAPFGYLSEPLKSMCSR